MEISTLDETEEWIDVPLDKPKDYGSDIEVGLKDNEKSSENSIPSNNEDLSSDEEDNVFNFNTVLVPEEPANNIYVNTTKKTIKKKHWNEIGARYHLSKTIFIFRFFV